MGYNTWYDFKCQISAQDITSAADAMIRQGLDKLGYDTVAIDDCWAKGRFPNGTVYADPSTFPNGIKAVADYVHNLGLKFGIYTDRGTKTCAGRPGSQGFETIDAQTYAYWGVDFLKEDSCNAPDVPSVAFKQYATMRDALNATGRKILFSLCGWRNWYAPEGQILGNMWRIGGDGLSWKAVIANINNNANLSSYAGPGGWNDPDMLLGTTNTTFVYLEPHQSRSQFSLWCVMTAPLLIGSNIINLNAFDLETYSNSFLIAVNQDPVAKQGIRVAGGTLVPSNPQSGQSTSNVFAKRLQNGKVVAVFFNLAQNVASVTCDATCIKATKLTAKGSKPVIVWDAWTNQKIGVLDLKKGFTTQSLKENGGSQTVVFDPDYAEN